jgi:signal peptidase I
MTPQGKAPDPPLNPWLSAPIRPRATIRQFARATPVHTFLLLCAAVGVANVLQALFDISSIWRDWPALAIMIVLGGVVGIAGGYVSAAAMRLAGRLLGGRASAVQVRRAVAWGSAPVVWGLLAAAVLLPLHSLSGGAVPLAITKVVLGLAGLWSLVTIIAMLMEVQGFGIVRGIASFAAGSALTLGLALGLALVVRVLLWQPFNIPSGAMSPTLIGGDHIFVSKYAYGYGRHSFPAGLTSFPGRVLAREPERGDVVAFKLPRDNRTDYVKRLIGLPGDIIQMRGGVLYINGTEVPQRRVGEFMTREDGGALQSIPEFEETLPNGVTYRVLDAEPNSPFDNFGPYEVPRNHYFMIGYHRDNSTDSRAMWGVGYVPFENLVGRASIIYMSHDATGGESRTDRLLQWVH